MLLSAWLAAPADLQSGAEALGGAWKAPFLVYPNARGYPLNLLLPAFCRSLQMSLPPCTAVQAHTHPHSELVFVTSGAVPQAKRHQHGKCAQCYLPRCAAGRGYLGTAGRSRLLLPTGWLFSTLMSQCGGKVEPLGALHVVGN